MAAIVAMAAFRPAVAQEPRAPAPLATTVPVASTAGLSSDDRREPPDYCVRRFLSPLEAMAGVLPVSSSSGDRPVVADTKGAIVAKAGSGARPEASWLERIRGAAQQLRGAFPGTAPPAIDAIIATVADPIDSGLDAQFESSVEALELGAEHTWPDVPALFRDRSWLPWDDRAVPEVSRRDSEACRASTPGVLLFRSSDVGAPRLLALLVVGESPSAGVQRAALRNALVARDAFVADETQSSERVIRVVGPTFSGSAYSLRLGLREWAHESTGPSGGQDIAFRVVTGTATGSDVPRLLGGKGEALAPGATLSFQSTTIAEADAECAYLWFLHKQMMVPATSSDRRRTLAGVAALRESGTEFGSTGTNAVGQSSCRLLPSLTLRFPFHVSALRDAYETLEKGVSKGDPRAASVRATSLPAPMQEKHLPLELAATSAKSRAALDLTLSSVLEQISSRELRYVSIHSTDIGDAIFLARKIRDAAPDVRLAFFDANALLVHPDFRRALVGSFVVTPYPFLGVHPFVREPPWDRQIAGFASSAAEGLFNALLVQRNAPAEALSDYVLSKDVSPAPLWIASIGRGVLVPVAARPVPDCNGTLYGAVHSEKETAFCSARSGDEHGKDTWDAFNTLPGTAFTLDAALTRPRLWDFVFCIAVLAFWLDWWRERWAARDFDIGSDEFENRSDERTWDRFIARTKWGLYSVIRAYLFALAFTYMGALYLAAASGRGLLRWPSYWPDSLTDPIALLPELLLLASGIASWVASVVRTARALRPYLRDYRLLARKVGSNPFLPYILDESNAIAFERPSQSIRPVAESGATPEESSRWRRMLVSIGVAKPGYRDECARVSFGQLRVLTCATAFCAVGFSLLIGIDTLQSSDWLTRVTGPSVVARAVLVLRSIPLTNGVSPAAAVLLCIACAYLWAVGRMSRLHLAEKVSMLCSEDNIVDLVSTPIRQILQPTDPARQGARAGPDEGLTQVERDVLDSIWRPITGRYFVVAAVVIAAVPLVLFHLKPFSSIEAWAGSTLLRLGLALCVYLVGVTLLQLVQYWLSLERLLKRVMEHRLGPAFTTVAPFAGDSVDRLVSRSASDLLRWTASARQFGNLVVAADEETTRKMLGRNVDGLEECVVAVEKARQAVLSDAATTEPGKPPSAREAELGAAVVTAAARLMLVLEQAWPHHEAQPKSVHQLPAPPRVATGTDSAVALHPSPRWDRTVYDQEFAVSPPVATTGIRESGLAPAGSRESANIPAPRPPPVPTHDDAPVPSVHDAFAPIAYSFKPAQLAWLRRAQSFVATVVTLLLHRHVRQFRYFLYVLTGSALLLLLVITSYPFQPFRLMLTYLWVVTGSVVTACLWVYVQMERNTLLSHTAGTAPNEVTFDRAFFLRILTWGVIPLLGVAATQYPEFANLVFEVLSPFASALQ